MDLVDIIKKLTKNDDDIIINYWITKAIKQIIGYLNKDFTDEEVKTLYPEAIIEIVVAFNLSNKQGNVTSETQGARSKTYAEVKENFITDNIKALLPKPYIKLR